MVRFGLAEQRVGRFRGKQTGGLERLAESAFLSKRHIDWSKTKAYSQGNFGQIFVNQKGRQPQGCVAPEDVRPLLDDLKAGLLAIPHPETGEPLVEKVLERDELYDGPHAHLAPDLTVVLRDWRYRTIGLHDFTTNKLISPSFGPTGDHRMEGVLIASGPAVRPGASPGGGEPARHRPDGPPPARRARPRRHGRSGPDRALRPGRRPAARPGLSTRRPGRKPRSRSPSRTPRKKTPRSSSGWRTWAISKTRPGLEPSGFQAGLAESDRGQFLDGFAKGRLPLGVDRDEVGVLGGEPSVAA